MRAFAVASALLCTCAAVAADAQADYLAERTVEPDVVTLPSGLMYKVLRKGSGVFHPTADSSCECHYEGKTIDGEIFDSSYQRGTPTSFAPNQVIKGWTEAMQLMVEGDKWEMYIPSDLGYGDRGSPPKIPGGAVLIFQMEIIEIKGDKVPAITCDTKTYESCTDEEKAYVVKQAAKDAEGIAKELNRLETLKSKKGSTAASHLLRWQDVRILLLRKMRDAEL